MKTHFRPKMLIILVTGTPGTGKTFLSKEISKRYGLKYLNLTAFIRKKSLSTSEDKARNCIIVNPKRVNSALKVYLGSLKGEKGIVIDSLLAHMLDFGRGYRSIYVVVKCPLKTLYSRLKKRRYSENKVRENMDSEIFDVCLVESLERGLNPIILDGSKNPKSNIKVIEPVIKSFL